MSGEEKANDNPTSWMDATLALFVPAMTEAGTYEAFVQIGCEDALKDHDFNLVQTILSKYVALENSELYLVAAELARLKREQSNGMMI